MAGDSLTLLKELTSRMGVSGFEDDVRAYIDSFLRERGFETFTDGLGSLIARKPSEGPKVMLVAHMDEIGMVVRYIDDKGYLYVTSVGGVNPRTLPGARLIVWTKEGPLEGVVGEKPIHRMKDDERKKAPDLESVFVDLGLEPKEVKEKVRIGDPISFKPVFSRLGSSLVASKALDDRIGCLTLMLVADELAEEKLEVDLYLAFSAREEIGLEGARTAAFKVGPEVAVAVDVTHAGDTPVLAEKDAPAKLGRGPVISLGAALDKKVSEALLKAAKAARVDYQLEAEGGRTGTDIDAVRLVKGGVRAGLVSLPLRYMHTPSEVASVRDAEQAAKLLVEFVREKGW